MELDQFRVLCLSLAALIVVAAAFFIMAKLLQRTDLVCHDMNGIRWCH